MVASNASRIVKPQSTARKKKLRVARGEEDTLADPDAFGEGSSQIYQAEDEKIMEDINKTTTKLEEFKDGDGGRDQWSRAFMKQFNEDKERVMANLENAKALFEANKKDHENAMLEVLAAALSPAAVDNFPIEANRPLRVTHVTAEEQPLFQHSISILDESKLLLDTYNALANRDRGTSALDEVDQTLKRDQKYIKDILDAGKKVAKSDIENRLADCYNKVRDKPKLSKKEEELGQVLFSQPEKLDAEENEIVQNSEGWSDAALRTMRAARYMESITTRK